MDKQFLRDVALAHQSILAEKNRKAIAEMHAQLEATRAAQNQLMRQLLEHQRQQEKRADAQRQLKQLIFELRQQVDTATSLSDPIRRCIELLDLQSIVETLHPSNLDDLSDKHWHADTQNQIVKSLGVISKEIGDALVTKIINIRSSLARLDQVVTPLIEFELRLRDQRPDANDLSKWQDMHNQVIGAVVDAERHTSGIPEEVKQSLPLFRVIAAAREGILDPVAIDRFAFKCVILVAKADGRLKSAETALLHEFGIKCRLARDEVDVLVRDTRAIQKTDFMGNRASAERIVRNLCRCASVDGSVSQQEEAMIRRIARVIGLPGNIIDELLSEGPLEPEISIIDPDRLLQVFRSKMSPRDKKHMFTKPHISADLLEVVMSTCSVGSDEELMLAGDWKVLGVRTGAFLMTNRNLYIYSSATKTHRASICDIIEFKPRIMSGTLVMRGQGDISTPNIMNRVLEALVIAITSARRIV